jgi:hypothetical protein
LHVKPKSLEKIADPYAYARGWKKTKSKASLGNGRLAVILALDVKDQLGHRGERLAGPSTAAPGLAEGLPLAGLSQALQGFDEAAKALAIEADRKRAIPPLHLEARLAERSF